MATFPQTDVAVNGVVLDGAPSKASANSVQRASVDPFGNLLVAEGLPGRADVVRRGYSFVKSSDLKVAVAALPTTTSGYLFINLHATRSCILDRAILSCEVARDTAGDGLLICNGASLNIATTSQTATADTLTAVYSLNGGVVNAGTASSMVSSHACGSSAVAGHWFALASVGDHAVTTDLVSAAFAEINGMIIIPPQRAVGLDFLATDATIQGAVTLMWHEQVL